jgi:hypothetical protein
VLPFTDFAVSVAVDTASNVYITVAATNQVMKLAADTATQSVLPLVGLRFPTVWRWIPPATSSSPTRATVGS